MEDVNQTPVKLAPKGQRSYRQFCALARALDVVGERWSLLIVRELLPGPMRYTDLKGSLAGIATNLLASRLRTLEDNGIVERQLDRAGVVYGLTSWGAELREPMEALGRWGTPLLASGRGDDTFQPRWLTLALPALLRGTTANPPVELGIETDGSLMVLRVDADGPSAHIRPGDQPESVLTASSDVVVALAAGGMTIDQAVDSGEFTGEPDILRTIFARGTGG
ncbi:DNA-binding transcriptional regulator, HxlR family [Microlunatus soli]|uniref:DNA-binding transcriptional regulator, HxlR family n=2 Tax=Microlunatus soli TaxID=630515 RepID=A0A1H1Y0C0_9ACTN|nr:DNA-binding transcriptional regulator, HxlR family [Microlunatus soli]